MNTLSTRTRRFLQKHEIHSKEHFIARITEWEKGPYGAHHCLHWLSGLGKVTLAELREWSGLPIKPRERILGNGRISQLKREIVALRAVFEAAKAIAHYETAGAAVGWPDWDSKFDALKSAINAAEKKP
jgi:hypothetical protein